MGIFQGLSGYGDAEFSAYLRGAFAASMGYSDTSLSKPVVGITMTASDFNNCHRHVPELIDAVKRGVLAAGALPMVFPTMSLGESFLTPTSMFFRNLLAMETEELVRAQPMDAVVLIGGCDKTIPGQLMGALSAGKPAIVLPVGPMLTGRYEGERLGACTDCRRFWARYRGGELDAEQIGDLRRNLAVTSGTCPVMGTASTMACLVETMGMALPGAGTAPAVHADRLRIAEATGAVAAGLAAKGGPAPSEIVTAGSVRNALRMLLALSGSTNALVHLTAIARRAGIRVDADELNKLSDETPVLVSLKPTGQAYMEDLHAGGGVAAVLCELGGAVDRSLPRIEGCTVGEWLDAAPTWRDPAVVRSAEDPVEPVGGLVALRGTLAPDGAILKRAAATPALFERTGRAVVFRSLDDLAARIDDPDLDVEPEDFLVLQNAGPIGAGMPEAGYLPIPKKLLRRGVTDMVRLSDARMSGTAYGTVVLHVAPEAALAGPLAFVRDGDLIRLSVAERRLDLLVDDDELARRTPEVRSLDSRSTYARLFRDQVLQAPEGCDFRDAVSAEP